MASNEPGKRLVVHPDGRVELVSQGAADDADIATEAQNTPRGAYLTDDDDSPRQTVSQRPQETPRAVRRRAAPESNLRIY